MTKYIIAADITAAFFLLVPIFAMRFTVKKSTKKTKAYELCLWVCFIGLIFNALSYILSGNISSNFIVGAVNYLAFIFIDILMASYALYFYYMVKEGIENYSKRYLIIVVVLCIIDFVFLTVGTIIGKLFTVENGVYIGGILWDYSPIIPSICLTIVLISLLVNFKKLGKVYGLALISYILLTILCAILQLINVNIELGYVGSAISLLIMYVMLQSRIVYESDLRAEIYNELSSLDVLTGLKNRRGFQIAIESVTECETIAGIFCDLNNLKYVNDTLGHDIGDKYIQKFSNILKERFNDDLLFRISGDEFVIIIKDINEDLLNEKIKEFENDIKLNNDIASIGYSIGTGMNIVNVIKDAEKKMYIQKEIYYEMNGKKRRI